MKDTQIRHINYYLKGARDQSGNSSWFTAELPQIMSAWDRLSSCEGNENLMLAYIQAMEDFQE